MGSHINDRIHYKYIYGKFRDFFVMTFNEMVQKCDKEALNKYFCACIYNSQTTILNVKYMVNNGADPRHDDDVPLILACRYSNLAIVQYLVQECGADINADNGLTLINALKNYGNSDIIKYLIVNDVMITDQTIVPLLENYKEEYLVMILQKGYSIEKFAQIFWEYNTEYYDIDTSIDVNSIIYFLVKEGVDIKQSIEQFYNKKN